jgi:D-3-phosphoglycerate dehydrogenase
MVPEGQMVVLENKDQPGMIGFVGTTFGKANVNIADMVLSRDVRPDGTAYALMLVKVDSAPSQELIDELRRHPGILRVRTVHLPSREA